MEPEVHQYGKEVNQSMCVFKNVHDFRHGQFFNTNLITNVIQLLICN